jgi:hypothetical protein
MSYNLGKFLKKSDAQVGKRKRKEKHVSTPISSTKDQKTCEICFAS